ncbi:MAG: phenylalanine--tRNA ligase subunit beta, partial [Legionellales bacterium]|nr:phenylalanine--tRNA ligase subunit beta [Legionellales bacterium]
GMLCSAAELGLDVLYGRGGIMHLANDFSIGANLADAFNLNDHIFEIEITPDRGDCLSSYGVARDIAAISGLQLKNYDNYPENSLKSHIMVDVIASSDCLCYYGMQIKNIDINSTEAFYGDDFARKISCAKVDRVVDIANFAMLDKGQPFHVFDADKISGNITVRYSKAGELANLLNNETITLKDNTLVVADNEKILAIAGVMGCIEAKVSDTTTNIFVEAAHFTPDSIAKSCRDYRLTSESAYRFERGVDAQQGWQRLNELCDHILKVVGGEVVGSVAITPAKNSLSLDPIRLRSAQLKRLLGIDIDDGTITRLLERVGANVAFMAGSFYVTPPSWRFDLRLEVDLIEELMRLYGYNNIPKVSLNFMMHPCSIENATKDLSFDIATYLKGIGLNEALCYSMISTEEIELFAPDGQSEVLKLKNPISNNMTVMRNSLLPGLVKATAFNNRRQKDNIKFFEIGQCFDATGSYQTKVAGILTGKMFPENWKNAKQQLDFYDVKAICEQICTIMGLDISYEKSVSTGMHHGKSASIVAKDSTQLGVIGVIDPILAKNQGLCKNSVLFEITLPLKVRGIKQYQAHSKYPSIKRDLSLIVNDSISFAMIYEIITSLNIKILQKIKLDDVYYPDKENKNIKSFCVSFIFQHAKRTLLEEEIAKYITKIMQALAVKGIKIRS